MRPAVKILLLILGTSAALITAPTSASASTAPKWCWSMQGGAVKGTFTTTGTTPGDGTAAAGTYNLTDASVYSSTYADIETGSISDGTYAFGVQPQYQIIWNGTAVTGFYRSSGSLTNGLGIFNGSGGTGAYLIFDINYQSADTTYLFGGTRIFYSATTPTLSPAPASGLCAGEGASAGSGSGSGSAPPDVIEQYGRSTSSETCRETYGPSYAMWMHGGLGGWVCTRTLTYSQSLGQWVIAT